MNEIKIKIHPLAIHTFKAICVNEENTPPQEVIWKISRNFSLGRVVQELSPDIYIKKFGTFCMVYDKGLITWVYHEKENPIAVNRYEKYTLDGLYYGWEYANAKYCR